MIFVALLLKFISALAEELRASKTGELFLKSFFNCGLASSVKSGEHNNCGGGFFLRGTSSNGFTFSNNFNAHRDCSG